MSMQTGLKAALDCIRAFSETDFTEDLKRIDVPTLFLHGDDDQIVPIKAAAETAHRLVAGSELKVYPGGEPARPRRSDLQTDPTTGRTRRPHSTGTSRLVHPHNLSSGEKLTQPPLSSRPYRNLIVIGSHFPSSCTSLLPGA